MDYEQNKLKLKYELMISDLDSSNVEGRILIKPGETIYNISINVHLNDTNRRLAL